MSDSLAASFDLPGATADCRPRLLSPHDEARAFWRLRRRLLAVTVRQVIARSRLRLSLIVSLSAVFWTALFLLFLEGFQFLDVARGDPRSVAETIHPIFNVFFVSLMIMLLLSAAILLYSSLFRSGEAAYLLTVPVRPERVAMYKFQEAVVVSSWGFVLLGSPMLMAYGVVADAPWHYFALLAPYLLAFVFIPTGLGAMLCLLVVRYVPRVRVRLVAVPLVLLAVAAVAIGWQALSVTEHSLLTSGWFSEVLGRFRFSEHRLLPSWWLASGLLEASNSERGLVDHSPRQESLMFLALLVSNALFVYLLTTWTALAVYRPAYCRLHGEWSPRRPLRRFWLDWVVATCLPLPRSLRLLFVKDLRLFRRDPLQWSQFLIFFGLLGLYFANIRRFQDQKVVVSWVNMISFLNLAVVGLILSTFTTRFIYPMVSLEGRRMWVLGLMPLRRETVLLGKFAFAVTGSLLPCSLLIGLSDLMLQLSWNMVLVHQLTCAILCMGLSGLAVGLGARVPELREDSPAKIAAGFGGTLNLVLSALYIVAVVLLTALPFHFYLETVDRNLPGYAWVRVWVMAGAGASLLLGVVTTAVPMWLGIRAFRRLEL